jgi:DnaJ-class molecular chaperone
MTDHYTTLGVAKNASQDEIKRAYRKLASQHHPDKGGDKNKFQEVQAAYDTLGDADKRAAYDNPRAQFGSFGGGFHDGHVNINDIFGQMFGGGFGGFGQHQHPRRNHMRVSLWLQLTDIALGGKKTVAVNTGQSSQTVEIDIPLGLNDGDNVQYPGIAPGGQDLVITFRIHPDPVWHRQGLNLSREHRVSIWDLILGGDIVVKNIYGEQLTVRVPAKCQPGTSLRLREQGLRDRNSRRGDMMVKLLAEIPQNISGDLVEAIQKYR